MESPFHYVLIRTFCYATEDSQKVKEAFLFVANCEEEKIRRKKVEGYFGDEIEIFEITIKNASSVKKLCKHIFTAISKEDIEKNVDDDSSLILKFSKQDAFERKMLLTHGNDVIFLKGKIRAYPSNKENAIKTLIKAKDTLAIHRKN